MKMLVSRTTLSMGGPQLINGLSHILSNLIGGNIGKVRPDLIEHLKTGSAFYNTGCEMMRVKGQEIRVIIS